MASVPPRIADHPREHVRRWIPAEVWQKQGMSAQEMTLPLGEELKMFPVYVQKLLMN